MRIVFLDVDGVLNFKGCLARSSKGYKGISDKKMLLLKEIVEKTGAEIVLTSTWKCGWHKDETKITDLDAKYLIRKFHRQGLKILDKTFEDSWLNRGRGIYSWLALHEEVTDWVILDDEIFPDYEQYGMMEHLVKTECSDVDGGGLQPRHVEQVISILNSKNKRSG